MIVSCARCDWQAHDPACSAHAVLVMHWLEHHRDAYLASHPYAVEIRAVLES